MFHCEGQLGITRIRSSLSNANVLFNYRCAINSTLVTAGGVCCRYKIQAER
jgi:hypothetical protein